MDDMEQKRIFASNLRYQISLNKKTQKEVAEALGTTKNNVNNWCQAVSMPSAAKVQKIADYFRIPKTQLLDDFRSSDRDYLIVTGIEKKLIEAYRLSEHKEAVNILLGLN